jgi:hypothetical protein
VTPETARSPDGGQSEGVEGRALGAGAPAPPRFHYTLVTTSGAVVARHEADEPLQRGHLLEPIREGEDVHWRVLSVLGVMATISAVSRKPDGRDWEQTPLQNSLFCGRGKHRG